MTKEKKKDMEGMRQGMKMSLAADKNSYIRHTVNGRYFLARVNMIAEQVQNNDIKENIDGCPKTEEFMRAEYAHQKMQAIMEMRNAHFVKIKLKDTYKLTEEDIYEIEEDYYNGKVVREEYDESYNNEKKPAGAVKSDK